MRAAERSVRLAPCPAPVPFRSAGPGDRDLPRRHRLRPGRRRGTGPRFGRLVAARGASTLRRVVPEPAARERAERLAAGVGGGAVARRSRLGAGGGGGRSAPGLVGSLLVGFSLGSAFAWSRGLPFFAVHHLEGHLYSPFLRAGEEAGAPAEPVPAEFVGLVVSGGHTSLYRVRDGAIETIAETRDDALGEAFDKVGKRVGLPYPQGPQVDRLAELGDAASSPLPSLAGTEELFFSYSGLKTQAITAIEKLEAAGVECVPGAGEPPFAQPVLDLLAGFRASAVRQILDRLTRFHRRAPFERLAVSGGAAANRLLRRALPEWAAARGVDLRLVPLVYSGDNAAMIAFAALRRFRLGLTDDPLTAEVASRRALGTAGIP
ncbi:MAG: tRNA (adenosine(37)-N6)-threonylcarbamoyltransferase complex transferase subunit TsaD [Thermoanaerobaculia bacterium]